jgi:polyhydroxyalkanoate synthesis regulator phasin
VPEPQPRPETPSPNPAKQRKRRLQQLRAKLTTERGHWTRWMSRLKRAFHSVEKLQQRITRLERQIAKLQDAR